MNIRILPIDRINAVAYNPRVDLQPKDLDEVHAEAADLGLTGFEQGEIDEPYHHSSGRAGG
ncbi:hypothetical protein ABU162_15740 [Paenibacillus thiaminolyticus]|uniref:hypothetical protein n=1 Tax=Paenibacillus thiaminolyticus TaxID=49283 RepID=UPI0035A70FC5